MFKRLLLMAMLLGGLTVSLPAAAHAQSDILLRLRSGSPLGDRFRVDSAGGVVAIGVLGIGIIPASGGGERMMWHPWRASFRAGSIGSAGTQWDDANTGFYSWAGGYNTMASQLASFAFGYQSLAQGSYATSMGYTTNADGTGAVAIGYRSTADADYSVAIGQRASTNGHAGAMVFSDGSTTDSTQASANNQFTVRAAGGYRLFTNATMTTGMQMSAGGSSWVVISDRNRKENFVDVDLEDVLSRIRRLPVSTWRYLGEEDRTVRHIGPMAQDWHALFPFQNDDQTINMSDLDGVNLAAVKALELRTAEQAAEIRALKTELEEMRRMRTELAEMRALIQELTKATPNP